MLKETMSVPETMITPDYVCDPRCSNHKMQRVALFGRCID